MILNEVMVRVSQAEASKYPSSQRMIDNLILAVQHITNREREVYKDEKL